MRTALLTAALLLGACLDPMVSDEVPFGDEIGDPNAPLAHVDDDPANAAKPFTTKIDYLKGFAAGAPIWYWNANGPVPELIAPMLVVENADGSTEPPVIDALPGEPGYSPWWRVVHVKATPKRTNERFTSRLAIAAGVELGLLEAPSLTTRIVDAVVVRRDIAPIAVGDGMTVMPAKAYYRGKEAAWVQWSKTIDRPVTLKELDVLPVYTLQRINETFPLYEIVANVDLDGDGLINASNNVFAAGTSETDYTPAWETTLVRTVPELRSIDTSTAPPPIRSDDDIVNNVGQLILSVTPSGRLVNCPIQVAKGSL